MPRIDAGFTVEGYDKLRDRLTKAKLTPRLESSVKKATELNALRAADHVIRVIKDGTRYDPNAPSTVKRKGSSKPLVDEGRLIGSIHGKARKWYQGEVGVLSNKQYKKTKKGGKDNKYSIIHIARILHEGISFTRRRDGAVIKIPRRPYLEATEDKEMQQEYLENWSAAIDKAFKGKG